MAGMLRETASRKRIVIWNAAGSAVYALSSFLLLIIVIRICGDVEGGIFSIGYAIAQLMLTVGVFESTTYFATDAKRQFSYEQFFAFKLATCVLMVVASIAYICSFGFDDHKAYVAYALCAYRLIEALSQFWFAAFQREERLDVAGFSTVWRYVISTAVLAVLLATTRDVVLSLVGATVAEALWVFFYDAPRFARIVRMGKPDFSPKVLVALFCACAPLFISSFLATYLGNVSKYAIEAAGTNQMQTIYNVLFMPSFVINLFMIFFVRPTLTTLAKLWLECDLRGFFRIIGKLLALVCGITGAVVALCAIAGIPLLELLYGIDLQDHLAALLIVLVGGGFLSASNVFYNAMVVIRAQNAVVVGYVVAIALAVAISEPMVRALGIMGAVGAYAISCLALAIAFAALFAFCVNRRKSEHAA